MWWRGPLHYNWSWGPIFAIFVFSVIIYAPNKVQDQCRFFDKLKKNIEDCVVNEELRIILGGDFNVPLDSDLDCSGGRPFGKNSVKHMQDLCLDFDLVDIWCIRNPDSITWRQRNPLIQRRLDYWLISDVCQDIRFIPSINSDHSANFLHFNSTETSQNTALLSGRLMLVALRMTTKKQVKREERSLHWRFLKRDAVVHQLLRTRKSLNC